jgi:hypothetical protein
MLQLGTWESSYKNVINDDDTDNDELRKDEKLRKPSPAPVIPIPDNYCDYEIEEQFVYAKPVLVAILNEAYPPARNRHDNFIKGGMARKLVTDTACARGTIVPEDVDRLQERLLWWVLRDERRAQKMVDVDDPCGESGPPKETVVVDAIKQVASTVSCRVPTGGEKVTFGQIAGDVSLSCSSPPPLPPTAQVILFLWIYIPLSLSSPRLRPQLRPRNGNLPRCGSRSPLCRPGV